MKKYLVGVVGNFSIGKPVYNGQTAKTRDYYHYLSNRYGQNAVTYMDTMDWSKHLFHNIYLLLSLFRRSKNCVLILGANGRKTILPLAVRLKRLFNINIYFSVVGGGLLYEFETEKQVQKCIRKTDGVFVETKIFEAFLKEQGYENVYYAPVFSKREIDISEEMIDRSCERPLRFCTYSRVCKEKGISTAIDVIIKINERLGYKACELDIYGHPQPEYEKEFLAKTNGHEDVIHIHPYLDDSNALPVLAEHYMMLFPTYYEGEGFPIAIVECLKSGVPVIATDWHFNAEVICHEKTGYIYQLDECDGLERIVEYSINNPAEIRKMKKNCCKDAENFQPDKVLHCLYKKIEEKENEIDSFGC